MRRLTSYTCLAVVLCLTASTVGAQSLGEVAAKVKAAREAACKAEPDTCLKAAAAPTVLTDKDIPEVVVEAPVVPVTAPPVATDGTPAAAKVPTWRIETWKSELAKYSAELLVIDARIDLARANPSVSPTVYRSMLQTAAPLQATLGRIIGELRAAITDAEYANGKR